MIRSRTVGMRGRRWVLGVAVAIGWSSAVAGAAPATLTARQIVDRCIAARGGLAAWHAVRTMTWSGKLEAGTGDSLARSEYFVRNMARTARQARSGVPQDAPPSDQKQIDLPFVLDLARPNRARVEIRFAGHTAIQVFDGQRGWMVRPYLNRNDAEPFTPQQAKAERDEWNLDGPLMDYAADGGRVRLEGTDTVDGRTAYRIRLTAKDGRVRHFWIDAQTFLDVKVEGTPREMDGRMRTVWVYQRDFRRVQGLEIPYALETVVDGYTDTHKMFIDKVAVNP
ncbi:MAG: hypothetical protein KGL92_12345, partial [Gammaproteobacteria bacterium]|nr:hypothetical protein [Gammaproteobacteria bacterium]